MIPDFYSRAKKYISSAVANESARMQLVLYIIIIILFNIAVSNFNLRLDLTRNGTYSLSKKSREVVSGLRENFKIRVIFSHDLPAEQAAIYRYLKDILREYSFHAGSEFSYVIVPENDVEKEASEFGIRPLTIRELVDDQVKFRKVYMGLVFQQADLIEKVEALSSAAGLEYLITSTVEKISAKSSALLKLEAESAFVNINLYFDERIKLLPVEGISSLDEKIKSAVEKCNTSSYNRLKFNIIDTAGEKTASEKAARLGLRKIKWESSAAVPAGEAMFGLVVETSGKHQTIDINIAPDIFGRYSLAGLDKIEDRINGAVGNILSSSVKIAYLSGHGEADINDDRTAQGAALFKKILSDRYELVAVDLSREDIAQDFSMLVINGPRGEFGEAELYRIDQFILAGHPVVFFLDSFAEMQIPGQNMMGEPPVLPVNTGIEKLVAHYGIRVNKNIVLDKNSARVNAGNMIKDYPVLPIVSSSGLDKESVITRYLKGIAFYKAASLDFEIEKTKKQDIALSSLISSSKESWLMQGHVSFNPFMMEAADQKDMKSHIMAASISGKFESYFKGKNIHSVKAGAAQSLRSERRFDETPAALKSTILVVGTSEITRSGFLVDSKKILTGAQHGPADDIFSNSLFLHNIADYYTGAGFIPEMRSKSLDYNPVEKISNTGKFTVKMFNMTAVPLLAAAAALAVLRKRSLRRKTIEKMFSGASDEQKA